MENLFLGIYNFFEKRRLLFYVFFSLTTLLCIGIASNIRLQESIVQMLPQDKANEKLNRFYQNSKISDRILFRISSKDTLSHADPSELIAVCDELVQTLNQSAGEFIESIDYRTGDEDMTRLLSAIDNNLPFYLQERDYALLDSITTSSAIESKIASNYQLLSGPAGISMSRYIVKDPLGLNFMVYNKLQNLKGDDQIQVQDDHFFTDDYKNLVFFVNPRYPSSETAKNYQLHERLSKAVGEISINTGADIDFFGAPLVAAGNAAQIRKDIILTTSLSVLLLLILVAWFFRRLRHSLLMILPVICGAAFALAAIYLIKGEVSVISIGAGSIVLGIAVNYSLHFLMHHRYHGDIQEAIRELSYPMTIGSLTTVAGFLCLQFVKAPVLQDLGLFAALCLIGAAFASLVFLPHFIPGNKSGIAWQSSGHLFLERIINCTHGNKKLVWFFILLTPFFFYHARNIAFEDDMNKINFMTEEMKSSESEMNRMSSIYHKSVFVVAEGKTLSQALQRNEEVMSDVIRMQNENIISSYTGISDFILSEKEQEIRLKRWKEFWSEEKMGKVMNDLTRAGEKYRFKSDAFNSFKSVLQKEYQYLEDYGMHYLGSHVYGNFIEKTKDGYHVISILKPLPGKLDDIYTRLSVMDELTVFDRQFVIDNLVRIVNEDFNFIAILTSVLVFLALLISYGRIELALISFLPMIISWIWILGIMSLLDIRFNIINIILSTLVFALGDDYCIFTMDGLKQEYGRRRKSLNSVKASILFSVVTTIIGLGVLIFAKHPALKSIALVSIIGLITVWLVSQTLQPVLFKALISGPASRAHPPYTFWGLIKSVFAFSYFVFGAVLLSIVAFLFFRMIPVKKRKLEFAYHWIISRFKRSLIYIMSNVRKKIINETGENFSKPAVIIANHQSFLDILSLGMLSPKLIFLTNKWVWNSPVFGFVVRMADYYPVAEGVEKSVERLSAKVKEGYSIVIFPEGTRSQSGVMKRFHKGAFYLAEQLKIDLLPIVLHGTGYCMTKGEFLLKDGKITVKYLPRITPEDTRFGTQYAERAKLIGRYFREQYAQLRSEAETPEYFRTHLKSNYIYKGPVLEWYMKVKLRLEGNYKVFHEALPKSGDILDLGCGYGFLSCMLGLLSSDRSITAIDFDKEKIEIAQYGYVKSDNVQFMCSDVMSFPQKMYDAIVLSDVLHYLQPEAQEKLLSLCSQNLAPGGVFLIREGIRDLKERHLGTKLSEWFSTRIFRFNMTSTQNLSFINASLIENFAVKNNLSLDRLDNTRLTSNIIFSLHKPV